MKPYLYLLPLLLISGLTSAQEYPQHLTISRLVSSGVISEQAAVATLVASHGISQQATVRYRAGQSVTLQPGFVAQAGSVFIASIGPVASLRVASEEPVLSLRAYPNPFSGQTTIEYNVPTSPGGVRSTLTDAKGQVLRQAEQPAGQATGRYQVKVDGGSLPTGVYFYQLQVDGQSRTIRLLKQQ